MRLYKLIIVAALICLQGCEPDGGVIAKLHVGNIQGTFLIEDDERTTPLTRVRHSVYYVAKGE